MKSGVAYKKTCSYFIRCRLHSTCLYGYDLEVKYVRLMNEQPEITLADGFIVGSNGNERQLKTY